MFALAQSRPSLDDVYLQATGRTLMDAELAVAGQRDVKQNVESPCDRDHDLSQPVR